MVMALNKMPALSDYGAIIAQFLPFVVLIVVFYFFLIRPQRKRDKQAVSYTHLLSADPLPEQPDRRRHGVLSRRV